ncbi:MAG: 6-phospho-3-hexuloisomerase [Thermomicrobiales bacterium]
MNETARRAMAEITAVVETIPQETAETLANELLQVGTIVGYGLGREMLMLRAFCMRLMHLGFNAHVAGDVTTPPVGPGDLVIITVGPGELSMAATMLQLTKQAGARVVVVTAQPDGSVPRAADRVIHIPAQTMANDQGSQISTLPMGSVFEIALLIFFDLVVLRLIDMTSQTTDEIRQRHTNLE